MKSWEEMCTIHCHELVKADPSTPLAFTAVFLNVGIPLNFLTCLTLVFAVSTAEDCQRLGRNRIQIQLTPNSALSTTSQLPTVQCVGRSSLIQVLMLKTQFVSKRQYKPQCSYPLPILTSGSAT